MKHECRDKSSTRHMDQFSSPFSTFSSVVENLAVVERLFWQLRHSLVAVDVVERFLFKNKSMYGLSGGTKERDRCREMAVVERWQLDVTHTIG